MNELTETISLNADNFQETLFRAKKVILSGGIMVYPTDTLYGLGGDATSDNAVERINSIKKVETFKPMSVVMSDIPMIEKYCIVEDWQKQILREYLPGPYTFILRARKPIPATDNEKLGVRIPDSTFSHELAGTCNLPILSTSANITGKPAPFSFGSVDPWIIESSDLAVDEGFTRHKHHSSIVDLIDKKIIRKCGQMDISSILP